MALYFRNGNIFTVSADDAVDVSNTLPVGNYAVGFNPNSGFYLQSVDIFEINHKIYGNALRHANRIMTTFLDRSASTGVMLAGEKGSGKTLLAKQLTIDAFNLGIPTLIINTPFRGDSFNKFMQDIEQPVVVLFDEFEKVFDKEGQEALLTLLDGTFPSKKLFILTCNDKWKIDSHMRNRPGRIFYMMEFAGLDADFIREYCFDNLVNQSHVEGVVRIAGLFDAFNFDMLKALVEDMNRYDEAPNETIQLLNAKPQYSNAVTYEIVGFYNGQELPSGSDERGVWPKQWKGNPLTQNFQVTFYIPNTDYDDKRAKEDENYDEYPLHEFGQTFGPKEVVDVDRTDGSVILRKGEFTVKLIKQKDREFDWRTF